MHVSRREINSSKPCRNEMDQCPRNHACTSCAFVALSCNFVTDTGNIKSYLYKCKIIDNPQCQCKNGDQTVQHIIFECTIFDQERDKLKAVVMRTENWPVSFNKLSTIYYKNFKEYIDSIIWDND